MDTRRLYRLKNIQAAYNTFELQINSIKNSPDFKEPKSSLPHSEAPATCPYPEPD
jgi:hypothetical protein